MLVLVDDTTRAALLGKAAADFAYARRVTAPILLFDGVCHLCHGVVRFILEHERAPTLRFGALQSAAGLALLREHGLAHLAELATPDTLVLIEDGRATTHSTAALRVAAHLCLPYRALTLFRVVPTFVRDAVYRTLARHRYRWFGKSDSCLMPTPERRARFLSD